jgi:hypothetical protein
VPLVSQAPPPQILFAGGGIEEAGRLTSWSWLPISPAAIWPQFTAVQEAILSALVRHPEVRSRPFK